MPVRVRSTFGIQKKRIAVTQKVRVLVIDDSALVRSILTHGLNADGMIEVVASAADPYAARDLIVSHRPDVLTLDIEMPRMDGLEFLRKLMAQYPMPVIMVSALAERGKEITMQALEAGAFDFISKPRADVSRGLESMMVELREKVKAAASARVQKRALIQPVSQKPVPKALAETTDKIILIGASAGGTEAIKAVVTRFPANTPGVVIVQHMPSGFTRIFAERLNSLSEMAVKEAEDGDRVLPGRILVAPGGKQLELRRSGGIYQVGCRPGENVCGHCPSVEHMMLTGADCAGANAVGVILTGMGKDGALGLKALRMAGAHTIAQDEATSVVFGMPKAAIDAGGAEFVTPLNAIADKILSFLTVR